jgi:hypothetical protein
VVTNVVTVLIPLWGLLGIWTHKFGYAYTRRRMPYMANNNWVRI